MSDYRDTQFDAGQVDAALAGGPLPGSEAELKAHGLHIRARNAIDRALGKVEHAIERTAGTSAARKVRVKADKAVDRAEHLYTDARTRIDDEIGARPYRTLAIAAGVGVMLGLLMAKRERTIIYRAS